MKNTMLINNSSDFHSARCFRYFFPSLVDCTKRIETVAMTRSPGEVVLLTGARGFLGRHVLRHLCMDKSVAEIRGLDKLAESKNKNWHESPLENSEKVKMYQKDLRDVESCREIVRGVDTVLHCAALVTYDFPPPKKALHENNVLATENLVKICVEEGVERLVFCSTAEVTLQTYGKGGVAAFLIYSNESKMGTPDDENSLIFGEYALSKLRAEKIILEANGKSLTNGKGTLKTVALRPPFMYGEGDDTFIGKFLEIGKNCNYTLPRISGVGGKQQITYVGNAAWAFIRAKNTLRENPKSIAGFPITITDHSPLIDVLRVCQKVTKKSKNRLQLSSWSAPPMLSYFAGWIVEMILNLGYFEKLPVAPRSAVSYMGSLILYDRTRASIHLDYDPYYSAEESVDRSTSYYSELLDS